MTASVGGFHHIALKSNCPSTLADFYREVLGLKETARHVDGAGLRSVWLALEPGVLMIERSNSSGKVNGFGDDSPGLHLVAYRIEPADRSTWQRRLKERGLSVQAQTDYSLYFSDPEGHRFALSHWPVPSRNHPVDSKPQ